MVNMKRYWVLALSAAILAASFLVAGFQFAGAAPPTTTRPGGVLDVQVVNTPLPVTGAFEASISSSPENPVIVALVPEVPVVGSDFSFAIQIGGQTVGPFYEVTGLGSRQDVVEQKVVDQSGKEITRKLPGRLYWDTIVLKRAVNADLSLSELRDFVVDGNMSSGRVSGSVMMYDREMTPVAQWDFQNGWFAGLTITTDTDSLKHDFVIEEASLEVEGIVRVL